MAILFPLLVHGGEPVAFEWDYSDPPTDLAGFWLYRSPSSASFAQDAIIVLKLYNFPKTTRTCIEKNVPNGTWYWRLTAVDTEGNESDFSNEVTTTISDVTAPSGPENLRRVFLILLEDGKVRLVFHS